MDFNRAYSRFAKTYKPKGRQDFGIMRPSGGGEDLEARNKKMLDTAFMQAAMNAQQPKEEPEEEKGDGWGSAIAKGLTNFAGSAIAKAQEGGDKGDVKMNPDVGIGGTLEEMGGFNRPMPEAPTMDGASDMFQRTRDLEGAKGGSGLRELIQKAGLGNDVGRFVDEEAQRDPDGWEGGMRRFEDEQDPLRNLRTTEFTKAQPEEQEELRPSAIGEMVQERKLTANQEQLQKRIDEIAARRGKDYSRKARIGEDGKPVLDENGKKVYDYGKDYDQKKGFKSRFGGALKAAALGAVRAGREARPGEDIGVTLGRLAGGAGAAGGQGGFDPNMDEKMMDEFAIEKAERERQGLSKTEEEEQARLYKQKQLENIDTDNARQAEQMRINAANKQREHDLKTKTQEWKQQDREEYWHWEERKQAARESKDTKNYDLAVRKQNEIERRAKVTEGQTDKKIEIQRTNAETAKGRLEVQRSKGGGGGKRAPLPKGAKPLTWEAANKIANGIDADFNAGRMSKEVYDRATEDLLKRVPQQ